MNIKKIRYGSLVLTLLIGTMLTLSGCSDVSNRAINQPASGPVAQYECGYRFEQNGWIYLHIEGEPYERGFQHGYSIAATLISVVTSLPVFSLIG